MGTVILVYALWFIPALISTILWVKFSDNTFWELCVVVLVSLLPGINVFMAGVGVYFLSAGKFGKDAEKWS